MPTGAPVILSWEENKCCYSQQNTYQLFSLKMTTLTILREIAFTTITDFSVWDRSRVKWDNSQNSTQKMRTSANLPNQTKHLGHVAKRPLPIPKVMSIANKVNFFAKLRSVFFSYFSCMYNEGKVLGVEFLWVVEFTKCTELKS